MTGDIIFAAHIYVDVKKSQIRFHVHFSMVNGRFLRNEFANFKYSSAFTMNRADNVMHIPFEQFHPLEPPLCLWIAAIRTNPNHILLDSVFLICYLLAFCVKPVFHSHSTHFPRKVTLLLQSAILVLIRSRDIFTKI